VPLVPGARVLDAGGGTGTFSIPLAQALPHCTIIHLEPDRGMSETARKKAAWAGIGNFELLTADLFSSNFLPRSMSAIVSVHTLCAVAEPRAAIRMMADCLAPGGGLFVCDPCRRRGWLAALQIFWQGRRSISESCRIARMQEAGRPWLHDSAEFRAEFERVGLEVEQAYKTYRGCRHVVVCRKPHV